MDRNKDGSFPSYILHLDTTVNAKLVISFGPLRQHIITCSSADDS